MENFRLILVAFVLVAGMVEGQTPFSKFYHIQWGGNHVTIMNKETIVELLLDESSGAGFESKTAYLSGFFHMRMKLPENKSPGVVTTFFLSGKRNSGTTATDHDELDFEFKGTNDQPLLNTNIFANDLGGREQIFRLWFDPTAEFHTYNILWNAHQIVFYVDNIPIRVFKNHLTDGVNFPSGSMKVEASIWNASWAGAVEWSKGPFKAQYKDFLMIACPEVNGTTQCASQSLIWNRDIELDAQQRMDYQNVRKKYLVYDYCGDRPKKECGLPDY